MNLAQKHADEIRGMWQSRALRASRGVMRKALITAIAKEWPEAFVVLMKVTFAGFIDLGRPILRSYASIAFDGSIVCDVVDRDGNWLSGVKIFESEGRFIYEMRKLADELKLNDADRTAMFTVLQKWIAKDMRIGAHGQRLAS